MALIIFDLDGTLVDSITGIGYSMNLVLDEMGYEKYEIETYQKFVGNGIYKLVELALPEQATEAIKEEAYQKMLTQYGEHYDYELTVYEGIKETLASLIDKGHKIAVLTNKHQMMAEPIVERYFGEFEFVSVIGRREGYPKKPDPSAVFEIIENASIINDISDVYFIGDSEVDLMTARNAKVNEVIVSWGFRDKKYLETLKPENLIDHPSELLEIVG